MTDSILITSDLAKRQSRPANGAQERALFNTLSRQCLDAPDEIAQALVDAAVTLCEAHSAGISLLEGEAGKEHFRCIVAAGQYRGVPMPNIPRTRSVSDLVLKTNAVQLYRNPDRTFSAFRVLDPPLGEILLAPLALEDREVGTIWVVRHDEAAHFNSEDAQRLTQLASFFLMAHQLGASSRTVDDAHNARHLASRRMLLLWHAAQILLTAEEPDGMLQALFAEVRDEISVDTYFNFMVREAGDALTLASCVGIQEEEARKIERLEFGQAICGRVAQDRVAIIATDIQNSDDPKVQLVKGFGIRAYACNPLISGELLLGTLSFASHERDRFTNEELDCFRVISRYVAVAYERLHLIAKLRDTDRRKDEFLATLAHELRNPLAPIRSAVDFMRMKEPVDADIKRARDIIERQVRHMGRLVDDLLDVSRVTLGRIELQKERVTLSAILSHAIEGARPLLQAAHHELVCELPSGSIFVEADATRLSQVFLNLLNNAAKYTPTGGAIRIAATVDRGAALVRIIDSGIGIPEDLLSQIFDLFTQGNRVSGTVQGGLGIGLTIARRLVELHGGVIEARSKGEGQGSEFIVRLPLIASPSVNEGDPPHSRSALEPATRRILVVDDNRDAADSLAMLLQVRGQTVHTAYDGESAIRCARELAPEVILLDLGMPGLDGYETCRRLRAQSAQKPLTIIALTGWGQARDRARTHEAGFDLHWTKPLSLQVLEAFLRDYPTGLH